MESPIQAIKKPLLILLITPIVLLIFGIYHGLMQAVYRSGLIEKSSVMGISYYQGLTAHGVINAIVLTTMFAIAFGHVLVSYCLGKTLNTKAVWFGLILLLAGVLLTAGAIFSGTSSVLYTFYPPLKAHPTFYIGLTLFVVGSWIPLWTWIPPYREWRKENSQSKTPLAVVGIFATFIIWQICTLPVAYEVIVMLIPWSLGWVDGVNVVLARTLFWFFGHPLVYFWLLPAYVMYYTVLPKLAGGKLYSDFAGRFVFLAFIVLSSPLGLHHQFADPGIAVKWKGLHTVLTSLVAIPSLMTAFTIAASLEIAARGAGGKGLFSWWGKLPHWDRERWLFPYLFCGLVIFIFGGATGVVNASMNVNNVVHNTAWIPAHFHLTVGGPVYLAILGMTLYLLVELLGKDSFSRGWAMSVPYLWTLGLMLMSGGMFFAGLGGEPRRTNLGLSYLSSASESFQPEWVVSSMIAVVGACFMTLSFLVFFGVFVQILLSKRSETRRAFRLPLAEPYHSEEISFVRNFRPWVLAALVAIACAYIPPLYQILSSGVKGAVGYKPESPVPESRIK